MKPFFPLSLLLASAASLSPAATCEGLRDLAPPHSAIEIAEARQPGAFTPPGASALNDLPAFCRVAGSIRPSSDSDIRFEIWMPSTGWNGKFQGIGNGGYAGTIGFAALADAVRHGYAAASTDTGHAETNNSTANWALKHPEKIVDFGHRAIHETTVMAKTMIAAFYGQSPRRAYFNSCSNGGRQALMEAQRYPADYDGIIAGAPANDWTDLMSAAVYGAVATLAKPESYIPKEKLRAIESEALAQCDAADGVKDGLIENPLACRFDPAALLCKDADSDSCLTAPQLTALTAIYGGMLDSKGKQLFPGLSPGGEAEQGGWGSWITGDAPEKSLMFSFGTQFFKNMVYSDPEWPFRSFQSARDTQTAHEKMARHMNATDPDLGAFRKRGGKLILFHGWADAAIPAVNAIHYYDSVVAKMGRQTADDFVRLYMVPGMEHCAGGVAPNAFGQALTPAADRLHSLGAALEEWVENANPPGQIIATQYKTNGQPSSGVVRTRPLCTWPKTAHYTGSGSPDDAANFVCKQ